MTVGTVENTSCVRGREQQIFVYIVVYGGGEYAVAQFVEALRYKTECRGFDSRWCHWYFSLT